MYRKSDTFQNGEICHVAQSEQVFVNGPQLEDLDVETFVFIDLETTCLAPRKDKIAEICMVAIHRDQCTPYLVGDSNIDVPRIADRLRLAVDPTCNINPMSARLNKLTRSKLLKRNKQLITEETLLLLTDFLDRQSQPICLVAYSHNEFDFNFLRACIESFKMERNFDRYFSAQALVAVRQLGKASGKIGSYSLPSAYANFTNKSYIQGVHSAEGDVDAMIEVLRCVNEPHSALKQLEVIKKWFMKNEKIKRKSKTPRKRKSERHDPKLVKVIILYE
uniref:three-prime repair exonuclease 1-like n=1 Tax=Styela clava TaxID=7725 RepID=UPI00193ABC8C|nr:three-prime repair exonuclease 1-like [Styela clava]